MVTAKNLFLQVTQNGKKRFSRTKAIFGAHTYYRTVQYILLTFFRVFALGFGLNPVGILYEFFYIFFMSASNGNMPLRNNSPLDA